MNEPYTRCSSCHKDVSKERHYMFRCDCGSTSFYGTITAHPAPVSFPAGAFEPSRALKPVGAEVHDALTRIRYALNEERYHDALRITQQALSQIEAGK